MGFLDVSGIDMGLGEGAATLKAIHRLRYEVYIREFGFINPVYHPDGLLGDDFDGQGLHITAHKKGDLVAALRLVLHSERGFPLQGLIPRFKCPTPSERTGELSHLAIAKAFRRRKEDGLYGAESYLKRYEGGALPDYGPLPSALKKRRGPSLVLGLFRVAYQVSRRLGLEAWLMLVEPRLHALLNRYELTFRQVADPVGGAGGPRPCLLTFKEMETRMNRLDRPLMKAFLKGLETEYAPKF